MTFTPIRRWLACIAAAALSACGGGGGDDDPSQRTALPTLSQDVLPTGIRIDRREDNFFPLAVGNNWTFAYQPQSGADGTATLAITAGTGGDLVATESLNGESSDTTYRLVDDGILQPSPLEGAAPAAAQAIVGSYLEYVEPFYALGAERKIIRQGNWGEDLDGDGTPESFRLEVTQVLVGFESRILADGSISETAHFTNTLKLTLQPSDVRATIAVVTATENIWWAPNIGPVRVERSAVDEAGANVITPYTLVLTGGTVGGQPVFGL